MKIGQIFHNKYSFNKKKTFQVEIWPISRLNDSETQERGLQKVKIPKKSRLHLVQVRIHLEARKTVSIYRPELARVQFIRISDVKYYLRSLIKYFNNPCFKNKPIRGKGYFLFLEIRQNIKTRQATSFNWLIK